MTQEENDNLHKADQVYFLYDPQPVRLLDVIYVGPVMIYAGIKGKNLNAFVKWSLIGVGICTIVYNGANFFINEKRAMERRKNQSLAEEALANAASRLMEDAEKDITDAVLKSSERELKMDEQPESMNVDGLELPQEVIEMLNNTSQQEKQTKQRGRPKLNDNSNTKHVNNQTEQVRGN